MKRGILTLGLLLLGLLLVPGTGSARGGHGGGHGGGGHSGGGHFSGGRGAVGGYRSHAYGAGVSLGIYYDPWYYSPYYGPVPPVLPYYYGEYGPQPTYAGPVPQPAYAPPGPTSAVMPAAGPGETSGEWVTVPGQEVNGGIWVPEHRVWLPGAP